MTKESIQKKSIKKEVVEKTAALITSAFGLVAALAWNDAIKNWFDSRPAFIAYGPWIYAIGITIIAVIATIWIARVSNRLK